MGPSTNIDQLLSEKALPQKEHQLRVEFVRVYMRTRNAFEACLELGFMEAYAMDWAKSLMAEGLVRRLIRVAERTELNEDLTQERVYRYRAWMEDQATYYGPGASHGARVSAVATLMKVEGMEAPIKTESEVLYKGGVMIVPQLTSPDKWGEGASASQSTLKETVKD